MSRRVIDRVLVATSRTADDRKTLAAVRSLAGEGIKVTLGSSGAMCLPRYSRYCHGFLRYPDPGSDTSGFIEVLRQYLQQHPQAAVLPLCDYTTQAVVRYQSELCNHAGLCIPAIDELELAGDKEQMLMLAEKLGIDVPSSYCIGNAEELRIVSGLVDFPCILKLRRGAGGVGRQLVKTPAALMQAYKALPSRADAVFDFTRPLVQEFVPGDIHDVCLLFRHGEPRAAVTQKRLAMYPADGGVGIYNETTDDPSLRDQAVALLRALHWHGPAQVEFKKDVRDGRMRLMEVNPRFWGTLDLSIQAGVNFPYLASKIAVRGDTEAVSKYTVGLRFRWLFSYKSPAQPIANLQGLALLDAITGGSRNRTDLLLTDPLPHIVGFGEYLKGLLL